MENWISVLFGAFGIAVVTIVWEAIKFFVNRLDQKKKSDPENFIKKQEKIAELFSQLLLEGVEVQEALDELCESTGCSRSALYKMQNGGGIPQLGTVQTISILNESIREDCQEIIEPIRKEIQNFIIDGSYQKTLKQIINGDILVLNVQDLEPGQIRTLHEGLNNKKICIFLVTHIPELNNDSNKGFMIFAILEFDTDVNINASMLNHISYKKNQIKNIFNKFYLNQYSYFK